GLRRGARPALIVADRPAKATVLLPRPRRGAGITFAMRHEEATGRPLVCLSSVRRDPMSQRRQRMKIKSLQDLLVEELKDLYDAEHRILKALPKMAKAASNPQLRIGFEQHLEQT